MSAMTSDPRLKITALVLHGGNGVVIEGICHMDTFWLELPKLGWMRFSLFCRGKDYVNQGTWIAEELQTGPCPTPDQSISWRGVLLTRRAALESHATICAYQQGLSRIEQSLPQSGRGGYRHEV